LYSERQRRGFLAIIFLGIVCGMLDYVMLGVALDLIKHEFQVSDTALGLLSGVCFALLWAMAALPFARWSDRGNRRTVFCTSLGGWSFMTVLFGLAQSFTQLALARTGVGALGPGATPAAQSLLADYFPPERRGSAIAIMLAGTSVGGLAGVGLGGYIAAILGWRSAFLMAGGAGIVLALVARMVLAEPRLQLGFPAGGSQGETLGQVVVRLWNKPSYLRVLLGMCGWMFYIIGTTTFLPAFMMRSLHATLTQVSLTWGVTSAVSNLVGTLAGGVGAPSFGAPKNLGLALGVLLLVLVVQRFAPPVLSRISVLVGIVLGTVIAVRLVRIALFRVQKRIEKSRLAVRGVGETGRLTALFDVLNYLAVAMVVGIGLMSALAVLGVNTGALLASAGVLGFALGFGAQTMVKDLLNGLFLLAEGQYTIGDEITVSGVTGVVERVTLRTTTLRATNGDIHIVPSGDVRLVTNHSKGWSRVSVDAGIAYTTPVDRALEVLELYCAELAADEEIAEHLIEPPKVVGVTAFQDHQYVVRVTAKVPSAAALPVERRMRRILRRVFEREGIETPVPVPLMAIPSSGPAPEAKPPASPEE